MATNPPAYDEWQKQPSIIIDPTIYVAEPNHETFRVRVLGALGTMVRATLAGLVISVTVFAITLAGNWLSHGAQHEMPEVLSALLHRSRAQAHVVLPKPSAQPLVVQISQAKAAPEIEAPVETRPALSSAPHATEERGNKVSEPAKEELDSMLRAARRQLAQRHPDLAEEAFRAVLEQRPSHPGALSGIARARLARGDVDSALSFARRAVEAAPAHGLYHAVLGEVLTALGESAAADLEYETASRLSQGKFDRTRAILPPNPYESAKEELADGSMLATP